MRNIRSFEASVNRNAEDSPLVEIHSADPNRGQLVGGWAYTRDVEKLWFLVRAVELLGADNGFAWSLNLSAQVRGRATVDPKWLFTTIQRHVRPQTPIVMALGFDGDRLHCHGAAAASNADDAERIKQALLRAAGSWEHSQGRAHQLHTSPISDADGWSHYLRRNIAEAKGASIVGPWWSATHVLRREAKAVYERTRAEANAWGRSNSSTERSTSQIRPEITAVRNESAELIADGQVQVTTG